MTNFSTGVSLAGLAPVRYSQVRMVYDTNITHYVYYMYDARSDVYNFISRIEVETYDDGTDKRTEIFLTMSAGVQALIDAQSWS